MSFILTTQGANLVGANEGDGLTPSGLFNERLGKGEKGFTINTESIKKDTLRAHVFLLAEHYKSNDLNTRKYYKEFVLEFDFVEGKTAGAICKDPFLRGQANDIFRDEVRDNLRKNLISEATATRLLKNGDLFKRAHNPVNW